jgi:hypothetical protein
MDFAKGCSFIFWKACLFWVIIAGVAIAIIYACWR